MLAADLKANPIALPSGYFLEFGGDSQERGELVADLMAPLGHDRCCHAGNHPADL
jgi:hypothetical protein